MPGREKSEIRFEPCLPQHEAVARALIAAQLPLEERPGYWAALSSRPGEVAYSPRVTWAAMRGEELVAAVEASLQHGRTAYFRPAGSFPEESRATKVQLIDALVRHLGLSGEVDLAQTMLDVAAEEASQCFQDAGFEFAAELLYLAWDPQKLSQASSGELRFAPVADFSQETLAEVIEATYTDTLDCPSLDGLRNIQDIVRGYRAVGKSGSSHWSLAVANGTPVGCLLLAAHPGAGDLPALPGPWELVYMGIIPSARGRGFGKQLIAQAQQIAAQYKASQLLLAVDAQNRPALRHYLDCGFEIHNRRVALLRDLRSLKP